MNCYRDAGPGGCPVCGQDRHHHPARNVGAGGGLSGRGGLRRNSGWRMSSTPATPPWRRTTTPPGPWLPGSTAQTRWHGGADHPLHLGHQMERLWYSRAQGALCGGRAGIYPMGRSYKLLEARWPPPTRPKAAGCCWRPSARRLPVQGQPPSESSTLLPWWSCNNPIRPEAPETFRYFAQQGVAVKVISGDNPATVSEVARQAGIEGAERFVDAAEPEGAGRTMPGRCGTTPCSAG